jgi:predicted aspartyl protease
MGTFHVEVIVGNLHERGRERTLTLLVDTGATYTTLSRDILDALGCQLIGKRRVLLANGQEAEWAVATVLLKLEGQEGPTFCLIGPNGEPSLLGAVTLEEFALGVDPVAKRLVPVRNYLTFLRSTIRYSATTHAGAGRRTERRGV